MAQLEEIATVNFALTGASAAEECDRAFPDRYVYSHTYEISNTMWIVPSDDLDLLFHALAHPLRRAIVAELMDAPEDKERTCGSFHLPVSQGTRTHHFKVLEKAGLIDQVDYGNRSGVTLRRNHIEEFFPGLGELLGRPSR